MLSLNFIESELIINLAFYSLHHKPILSRLPLETNNFWKAVSYKYVTLQQFISTTSSSVRLRISRFHSNFGLMKWDPKGCISNFNYCVILFGHDTCLTLEMVGLHWLELLTRTAGIALHIKLLVGK